MKKKISVFIIICSVFITLNIINTNISIATTQTTISQDGGGAEVHSSATTINPDDYDPFKNPITTEESKKLLDKVGVILGAIRNISAVVAVIALMIIGFKYIIGSAEEKANYKATMWPYVIGCIMVVSGTTIVSYIYNMLK